MFTNGQAIRFKPGNDRDTSKHFIALGDIDRWGNVAALTPDLFDPPTDGSPATPVYALMRAEDMEVVPDNTNADGLVILLQNTSTLKFRSIAVAYKTKPAPSQEELQALFPNESIIGFWQIRMTV